MPYPDSVGTRKRLSSGLKAAPHGRVPPRRRAPSSCHSYTLHRLRTLGHAQHAQPAPPRGPHAVLYTPLPTSACCTATVGRCYSDSVISVSWKGEVRGSGYRTTTYFFN